MAHEVEQMFSVKETPWHGLGHIVQSAPTISEAINLAGLNWGVHKEQLACPDGTQTDAYAVRRDTDKRILGVVGERYTPLQNQEAFNFFQPYVDSGLATLETAGSLREGERIWVLAALNKAPVEIRPGDAVRKFLLLSNGHDGLMGVRVGFTPIRVVCANTLAMSHASSESKLVRLVHSKQVLSNLNKMQEVINAADASFEATAEMYKKLAATDINQDDIKKYVRRVFKPDLDDTNSLQVIRFERLCDDINKLFEQGYGNGQGTYWDLYNAATQYLSYDAARNQDNRLNSLWFGQNKDLNVEALKVAVEMAVA